MISERRVQTPGHAANEERKAAQAARIGGSLQPEPILGVTGRPRWMRDHLVCVDVD